MKIKELGFSDVVDYINKFGETTPALFLGCLVLAGMFYILKGISENIILSAAIIFLSILVYITGWFYLRFKIPKNKKRLGILISIETDNQILESKFKKYFIQELDNNLSKNSIADSVDIYFCSGLKAKQHNSFLMSFKRFKEELENKKIAKKIPLKLLKKKDKAWRKFIKKTNRSFFIWGDLYEEESELLTRLNSMVFHGKADLLTRQLMKKELNNIFPQKITLDKTKTKDGFLMSAKHFSIVTKHICGMAALNSKNYELACDLLNELLQELESSVTLPQQFDYLKDFIKEMLAWSFLQRSFKEKRHDPNQSMIYIEKSLFYDNKNFDALNLKTYLEFFYNRNIQMALKYADESSKYSGNNYIWAYNKAFLLMYSENFSGALKLYKRIFGHSFIDEDKTVDDVINFNKEILKGESDKIQCNFIIGYILCRKKKNLVHAYSYFSDFVQSAGRKEKYKPLVEVAKIYLNKVDQKVKQSRSITT